MTMPIDPHEPRPEFLSHLEWQIQSALRRESRLAAPVTGMQRLRMAAAIAAALIVGVAGGVASGEIQDARQRDVLMLRADAEQQLLRTRYELAKAEYEDARRRFEIGTGGRESMAAAELQMREMEMGLKRLQINLAEIQATSAPPNDALDAPLVGKRDFVNERQMLDLLLAEQTLMAAERQLREVTARAQVGTATDMARLRAEAERALARERVQLLQMQRELRQRFLNGQVQPGALATEARRAELRLALQRAEQELALAREQLTRLRKQVEVGLAGQLEVKRAEVAILEAEVQLQLLRAELDALGRGK